MQQNIQLKTLMIKLSIIPMILGLTLIDLISKSYLQELLKGKGRMGFLPKILNLVYVENRGAAFSILEGKSFLLIGVAIIFLIVILYVIFTKKLSIAYINVLTLISAGCIGNLYDRIRLGYVRDFFEFDFIKFPVFNVADIYITLAALYLIILVFTDRRDNANNK